jgi:ubiquinone/menaquinone biosynthesis C-methylase UbiE
MSLKAAYNQWANIYDTNINATRDLEGLSLQQELKSNSFEHVLEIGCGTGKNTSFLASIAKQVLSVDFSVAMLEKAKEKTKAPNVKFAQIDISASWEFTSEKFDAIIFSLILEHFENIEQIIIKAKNLLKPNGIIYIGELHPFKQYTGSVAKYTVNNEEHKLESHLHSISKYFKTLNKHNFTVVNLNEWYDDEINKTTLPRILTLIAQLNK